MDESSVSVDAPAERTWRPLSAVQRRVFGVLVEKAKTTPDAYPMTLNALTSGCNQKSNRSPQMDLSPEKVEQALEELRQMQAAAEVQSAGRVPKYRHYMYEWLGVDKVESAVMTELLLRGEQTVGELRGRAARMEPIADVAALKPILKSLIDKGLVVSLTPEGRGQIVSHALYTEREMNELKARIGSSETIATSPPSARPMAAPESGAIDALRAEVEELRGEVERLKERLDELQS